MVKYDTLRMLTEAKLHKSMSFGGMNISIEAPAGGYRTGVSRDGTEWKQKIGAHYGYIKGTHSPDGEHLDCYVRKNPKREAKVYVVHQLSVDGAKFDEDKVMLGFASAAEARRMFKACTFRPTIMYGGMSEFTLEHFRLAAYSASRSKAMLTDEETFADFKKRGLMPRGIRSPLEVARKVSESVTEGAVEFQGLLADSLQDLGTALAEGDVKHCLEFAGYEGCVPRNEKLLNQLIGEAFQYFMESGIQNSNYLDDEEFRQRALMIITNEDSFMTDITNDYAAEDDTYGYEKMPQLNFEDSRDCDRAYQFANDQFIKVSRDTNTLYFQDQAEFDKYNEIVEITGDPVTTDTTLPKSTLDLEPSHGYTGESYTVMVSTQLMENVGSEFAPMWSHSTGRYIPVQTGLQSYGAARKIVAEVSAGLIPVELSRKESVIGIEIVTDGDYRQFYESVDEEDSVEEETTAAVFFAQQVQEMVDRAGIEEDVTPVRSSPSIHDLKARLAAIQEEYDAARAKELLESPFQADLSDFPKAMRIVGKTLIKNSKASAMGCVRAVARDVLGDEELAEELKDFIQDQTDMGLEGYAHEVRENGVMESLKEATTEAWTCVQKPTPDVTGDDADSVMSEYGTTDLVRREPADPSDEFSRDVLTYMNPERTAKVVMRPSYDGGNGEYYMISAYRLM